MQDENRLQAITLKRNGEISKMSSRYCQKQKWGDSRVFRPTRLTCQM